MVLCGCKIADDMAMAGMNEVCLVAVGPAPVPFCQCDVYDLPRINGYRRLVAAVAHPELVGHKSEL